MTPTPRKPRVDWDAARAFYLSLGPEQRTYASVATEFSVSATTVQKWAKKQDWPAQAAAFDAAVADENLTRAIRTRAQRVEETLRYVDTVIDRAAGMVGTTDVKPTDVAALVKLAELLLGEPTDRIQISQLQPLLDAYDRALDELRDLAVDSEKAAQIVKHLDEELLAVAARARGET